MVRVSFPLTDQEKARTEELVDQLGYTQEELLKHMWEYVMDHNQEDFFTWSFEQGMDDWEPPSNWETEPEQPQDLNEIIDSNDLSEEETESMTFEDLLEDIDDVQ